MTPSRPVLRYHGSKWRLAPWLLEHLPTHRVYVEPFGGGAALLMRKSRAYAEIYNDLDGQVVNLFRVLRSPDSAARLRRLVELTPFARAEYRAAWSRPVKDPAEMARRTLVKAFMGFGAAAVHADRPRGMRTTSSTWQTGFRAKARLSGNTAADNWKNYPACIPEFVERLQGVVIEQEPAAKVIRSHDGPDALFYVDPPYPHSTRSAKERKNRGEYSLEMTDADHATLAEQLRAVEGMVMVSSYPSPLYDRLYAGWERRTMKHLADHAKPRLEVLWSNPAAVAGRQPELAL